MPIRPLITQLCSRMHIHTWRISVSSPLTNLNYPMSFCVHGRYNIFIAMPITTSGSGIDPGILSDPVFALTPNTGYTVDQMSGCTTSQSSVSVYSMSAFQSSLSAS